MHVLCNNMRLIDEVH